MSNENTPDEGLVGGGLGHIIARDIRREEDGGDKRQI